MFMRRLSVAFLFVMSVIAGARADILRPTDPVKQAAYDVLDTHCARCHQTERLEGRKKVAKAFDHVLDLDALSANVKYVQPGDPEKSLLVHTMVRKEMPYDVFQEGDWEHPAPQAAELEALRTWIKSLDAGKPAMVADQKTTIMAYAAPVETLEVKPIDLAPLQQIERKDEKGPSVVMTAPRTDKADKEAAPVAPKAKRKVQLPRAVVSGKPLGEFHPRVALRQPSPHAIVREKPSHAHAAPGGGGGSDTVSSVNGI